MVYELHITRKKNFFDDTGETISEGDWSKYIEGDPELERCPENGPLFVNWNGQSENPEPWFDWWEGNIFTKNPDHPVIEKMLRIAKALDAKVQGDDGEVYLKPDESYHEE